MFHLITHQIRGIDIVKFVLQISQWFKNIRQSQSENHYLSHLTLWPLHAACVVLNIGCTVGEMPEAHFSVCRV